MILKSFCLATLLYCYWSFYRSLTQVFNSQPERQENKFSILVIASPLTWIATIYDVNRLPLSNLQLVLIITFVAAFFALYRWTAQYSKKQKLSVAFSLDKPNFILTEGPYTWLRHPFYTSYLGIYYSVAIITLSPYSAVGAFMMTVVYVSAALFEENKFANSEFSEAYLRYKNQTGMFIPWSSFRSRSPSPSHEAK